jgi:hypothetical protein
VTLTGCVFAAAPSFPPPVLVGDLRRAVRVFGALTVMVVVMMAMMMTTSTTPLTNHPGVIWCRSVSPDGADVSCHVQAVTSTWRAGRW